MHIFIDESGIFSNPANKTNVASVVAALSVPTTRKKELFKKFKELTSDWRDDKGEVKGRSLNEDEVTKVVSLLKKFDVILEMNIIDLGLHTDEEIDRFKKIQADHITATLTPEHHPNTVRTAGEIRTAFLEMPTQLYIEALMMFFLVPQSCIMGSFTILVAYQRN